MGLESATFISQLVSTNPVSSDLVAQGDDHLRLIKAVLQGTFPDGSKAFYLPKGVQKTAAYSVLASDDFTNFSGDPNGGSFTFTLPAVAGLTSGWAASFFNERDGANTVSVAPAAGTIDGSSSIALNYRDRVFVWLVGNAGTWHHFISRAAGNVSTEVSVASAATTDIGATISEKVLVTGTTTITSFGTRPSRLKLVRFADALTLTHNATTLVLPGGANIVTAAGDYGIFSSDASGNWRTLIYQPLSTALIAATAAQYRANTANKLLDVDAVWDAAGRVTLVDAATIAVDMSTGFDFEVTLAGNRTLGNPTNTKVGQKGLVKIIQDATGSRTLTFDTNYLFDMGINPTLSTAANATDYIFYYVDSSTRIICTFLKGAA